jgi:predicted ferric reductase
MNVTFSITVTGEIADVWAQYQHPTQALDNQWCGFGFAATMTMHSSTMGSDIFMCEQDGRVGRYWVTSRAIPIAERKNATGTCNVSTVGGVSTKTMMFSRNVNATDATERAHVFGDSIILLAKGTYPYLQHSDGDYQPFAINIPPPPSPGTVNSTAPTAPSVIVIPGYPLGARTLNNKVRIGWEVSVDQKSVRWAVETTGSSYVSLGFQDPATAARMTGDVVVAQTGASIFAAQVTGTGTIPQPTPGTYFTAGTTTVTAGTLRGEFTRTVAAPLPNTIAITDLTKVVVMVCYGNGFPEKHDDRLQLTLNLLSGASVAEAERSPAAPPKVAAIVILGVCALIGFIFTLGLSHTALGRCCFFKRVCQDSQFLGPRTPACFDITWGQAVLVTAYFALITLFSRLEFGAQVELKFLRAMGWTSTLAVACASIPVSRHSVLLYFFGMSFERAILIHRILGRTAILIVLMHFVAVLLEPQYQPFKLTQPFVAPYMIDLSLGFWAFMCMLVMFVTSLPMIRRKFFELFYYIHHLFIAVWVLAILHNKALVHQLTLIVPFALWGIDRLIRFYRGRIRQRELVSATIIADALRLEFKGDIGGCGPAESGSYAFINVPGVSFLQWHPFSISSRSGSGNFTFHIKNMGPGTFTGALHEYFAAKKTGARVNIDGPYGRSAVRFEEYESILLLAGGVGVTPMAAILDDLYEKCKGGNKPHRLEHVTFCWSVQSKDTIAWMEDIVKKIQANPSPVTGVTFDVQVFVTRSKEESPLYKAGRPKIPAIFEGAGRPKDGAGKEWNVGVLACGPEPMVVEAQKQSMVVGYDFHKEIFAF